MRFVSKCFLLLFTHVLCLRNIINRYKKIGKITPQNAIHSNGNSFVYFIPFQLYMFVYACLYVYVCTHICIL